MNLKGKQVINCVFGEGTVINQDETYITVEFISKTSKFVYPEAFERFLKAKDETVQTQMCIRDRASSLRLTNNGC